VTDFSRADGDRLHLGAVDAVAGGGDDAFAFIGTAAFTAGQAGQLRYQVTNGTTVVQLEVTGDGIADMEIALTGIHALRQDATAHDFIL